MSEISPKGEHTRAWDSETLVAPHTQPDKAKRVESMFDAIAPTYERVNRVVSLGQDARWRRRTVDVAAPKAGEALLDICCGTGDMIREFATRQPALRRIVGLDFSAEMLARGVYPPLRPEIELKRGDALALPFADASFAITSCAFGVRNFQDLEQGLREMKRVLKPGGRSVILEFALPRGAVLRAGYRFYTGWLLPRIATWISRDRSGAYDYLPQSIRTFEPREALAERLRGVGFADVTMTPMNFGGVILYRADKAAGDSA